MEGGIGVGEEGALELNKWVVWILGGDGFGNRDCARGATARE